MHWGTADRQAPERLHPYIARPALASERVQAITGGLVVPKLKTPWRDGVTHLVMSPLDCMQRHIAGQLCSTKLRERYVG